MFKPFAVQQFVREFFEALVGEVARFLGLDQHVEILEESPGRLMAKTNRGIVDVDKRRGTIKRGTHLLAPIKGITCIEVRRLKAGDEEEYWLVQLVLLKERRVEVVRLPDDTDASIFAAKLSTITEKEVVAIR